MKTQERPTGFSNKEISGVLGRGRGGSRRAIPDRRKLIATGAFHAYQALHKY